MESIDQTSLMACGTLSPFARFDAQVQLELAVEPVDALEVSLEPPDVAQVQVAQPKAPVEMCSGLVLAMGDLF